MASAKYWLFTVILVISSEILFGNINDLRKPNKKNLGAVIGIDLGTSFSRVAVLKHGRVEIIANDNGRWDVPSYVAFTPDGARLIGEAARNQLITNPTNTIFGIKRLIGRKFDEVEVQQDVTHLPFPVIEEENKPNIQIKVNSTATPIIFTPEELSGMILYKMKQMAEDFLSEEVTRAVISVPASFTDAQRQATKDAGTIAGLNVIRIINEPTAAAIAHYRQEMGTKKHVLVFDMGAGKFDASLLTVENGIFRVLATSGDSHLGGDDFDWRVVQYFIDIFKKNHDIDIRSNKQAVQKLRVAVEKAKRDLEYEQQSHMHIESLIDGYDFTKSLTRAKFEELNLDLFQSTLSSLQNVLTDADIAKDQVDEIVLVGGSTRIPKIRDLLKEFFNGKEPIWGINPDEAVVYGAAVQAGILDGEEHAGSLTVLDVNPITLGIETAGGVMTKFIPRNSVVPTKKSLIFSTAVDNQRTVTVRVYEGERLLTKDNNLLGTFDLGGILPASRGVPQIVVTFEIDADGILRVTASEKGTDNENMIVIKSDSGRLTPEELERMIAEAEMFAKEDERKKKNAEARFDLKGFAYTLKKQIRNKRSLYGKGRMRDIAVVDMALDDVIAWLEYGLEADAEECLEHKRKIEEIVMPIINNVMEGQCPEY